MGKSEGTICSNRDKFESEEKFAKAIWQTINNLLQAGYECLIKHDDVRNYCIEYCYDAGAFDYSCDRFAVLTPEEEAGLQND